MTVTQQAGQTCSKAWYTAVQSCADAKDIKIVASVIVEHVIGCDVSDSLSVSLSKAFKQTANDKPAGKGSDFHQPIKPLLKDSWNDKENQEPRGNKQDAATRPKAANGGSRKAGDGAVQAAQKTVPGRPPLQDITSALQNVINVAQGGAERCARDHGEAATLDSGMLQQNAGAVSPRHSRNAKHVPPALGGQRTAQDRMDCKSVGLPGQVINLSSDGEDSANGELGIQGEAAPVMEGVQLLPAS